MAQNVIINGVTYQSVGEVDIPLVGNGTARFVDTTDGTATAADILSGKSAYVGSAKVNGTLSTPSISQDATTKVLSIS